MKFSDKVGNGPMNKMIKFWWRSGSHPYRDIGKTCLGGGMPSLLDPPLRPP